MPRTVAQPLKLAAICAGLFGLLVPLAYAPGPARSLDATAQLDFTQLQPTWVADVATRIVSLGDPAPVAVIGLTLILVAVARGRPRVAVAVAALMAATSVGSQLLQALLAHQRPVSPGAIGSLGPAIFPSGHSTAAMTLALAAVMVAPVRLRPLVAVVGGLTALAVGSSTVLLSGHYPSDVVAGYLLAAGTALAVVAALRAANARFPAPTGRRLVSHATERFAELGLGAGVALGALAAGAFALAVLARLPELADFARGHKALALVFPAMAAAAVALVVSVTLTLSRRT